jgi:WD domain, G-beta repeat/WD40-like Beta Propeller Repeat
MVSAREKGMRKLLSRNYQRAMWVLTLGIGCCVLIAERAAVAGIFGIGDGSAHLAKVEFRLQESFQPTSVAWSPDGRYIAAGSTADRRIDIWDLAQRKIVKVLLRKFPPEYFHDISWSPNGQYLAFCDPGVLAVYRTNDWSEVHAFNGHAGCTASAFSSDSHRVALLGTHFLDVYSVPDWRGLKSVNLWNGWDRGNPFNALAYLPQSYTLLLAGGQHVTITYYGRRQTSWDGRVWFFGADDQEPSRSIHVYRPGCDHGGGGDARNITVSADGQYIVTGANTGDGDASCGIAGESVHILRASDGRMLAAPLDALQPVKFGGGVAMEYTHDGSYIIVPHGVKVGWVHILDGKTFKVIDLVRADAFPCDVAVNQVDDRFVLAAGDQLIVWQLPTT